MASEQHHEAILQARLDRTDGNAGQNMVQMFIVLQVFILYLRALYEANGPGLRNGINDIRRIVEEMGLQNARWLSCGRSRDKAKITGAKAYRFRRVGREQLSLLQNEDFCAALGFVQIGSG